MANQAVRDLAEWIEVNVPGEVVFRKEWLDRITFTVFTPRGPQVKVEVIAVEEEPGGLEQA